MVEIRDDTEPLRKRLGWVQRLTRLFAREKLGSAAAVEEVLRAQEENGDAIEGAHKDMILRAARFDREVLRHLVPGRVGVEARELDRVPHQVGLVLRYSPVFAAAAMALSTWARQWPWDSRAPLGSRVVPDVYTRSAVSSAPRRALNRSRADGSR